MKKITLTGGGTAGHVASNTTLLSALREAGYEVLYTGSHEGMKRELIEATGIPYCGTSSGKLRRYFGWKDFIDPFRVLRGCDEIEAILRDFQPDLIFPKDSYVAVPAVCVAKYLGIPAVIHESDMTPGLVNHLSYNVATKIYCNSPETLSPLPKGKAILTGSLICVEFLSGSRGATYGRTGFTSERPVFLVIGGSLGSHTISVSIYEAFPDLLEGFQVLRIADRNNLDPVLSKTPDHRQLEYTPEELRDYFALIGTTVSHASANTICEILALRRPNVPIPLSAKASRGDRIPNVRSYEEQGYSHIPKEETLSRETLFAAMQKTYMDRARYLAIMEAGGSTSGVAQVMSVLNSITVSYQ